MMEAILMSVPSWDAFPPDFQEMFKGFRTPEVGWDMVVNQNMVVVRDPTRLIGRRPSR